MNEAGCKACHEWCRKHFGTVLEEKPNGGALLGVVRNSISRAHDEREMQRRGDISYLRERSRDGHLSSDKLFHKTLPGRRGLDWGEPAPCQPSKPCGAWVVPCNWSQGLTLLRNATGVKKAFHSLCFIVGEMCLEVPWLAHRNPTAAQSRAFGQT